MACKPAFRGRLQAAVWSGLMAVGLAAAPAVAGSDRLADAITRAQALAEGAGGPVLYAFVDPRCAACRLLQERLQPLIRAGRVQVRWITVRIAGGALPPAAESVQANTALLSLLSGSVQTPTLAYRTRTGALRIRVGTPADLAQLIDQLQ